MIPLRVTTDSFRPARLLRSMIADVEGLLAGMRRELPRLPRRAAPILAELAARARDFATQVSERIDRWTADDVLSQEDRPVAALIAEFDALEEEARAATGRALGTLWDAFQESFGGIDGFMAASDEDAQRYLDRLDVTVVRMLPVRDTPNRHYYYALALMSAYLHRWRAREDGAVASVLSSSVVTLIDRSRAAS